MRHFGLIEKVFFAMWTIIFALILIDSFLGDVLEHMRPTLFLHRVLIFLLPIGLGAIAIAAVFYKIYTFFFGDFQSMLLRQFAGFGILYLSGLIQWVIVVPRIIRSFRQPKRYSDNRQA
jgi:hypothetical protein